MARVHTRNYSDDKPSAPLTSKQRAFNHLAHIQILCITLARSEDYRRAEALVTTLRELLGEAPWQDTDVAHMTPNTGA